MATEFAIRQASPTSPRSPSRPLLVWGVALTALALIIRLATLNLQSYWLDEAYTVHLVGLGFGGMLRQIPRSESTPPLYYAVAWLWSRAFGTSEVGLRSLSALAGTLTVAVGYALAARLAGLRAAIIAGLLFAVSPILVWYSQEARAYALATLLAAGSLLALVYYVDTDRARWLWTWAGLCIAGLATHYFVAFVAAPELIWLLRRRAARDARLAAALVVLAGVALTPLALAQRGTGHADYIAQGSLSSRVLQVPKQFLVGFASPGQIVTAVLAALLLLGAAVPLLRGRAELDRRTLFVFGTGVFAVVAPVALALVGLDFLNTRNVLVALPALIVVAAAGFAGPRAGALPVAAGLGLAVLSAVIVILVDTHPQYQRTDWRGAAAALGRAKTTRALVAPGDAQLPLSLYTPRLQAMTRPAAVREIDVVALPPAEPSGSQESAPRPPAHFPVPNGFRLISATYNREFTVLRYGAVRAASLTPVQVAGLSLTAGNAASLLQHPGG